MKQLTFQDIVDHFGGIPAMAERLGILPQAIYQWDSQIPPGRAFEIQVITKGKLKADQMPVRQRHQKAAGAQS